MQDFRLGTSAVLLHSRPTAIPWRWRPHGTTQSQPRRPRLEPYKLHSKNKSIFGFSIPFLDSYVVWNII